MSQYATYLNDSLLRLRTVLDDSGTRPILFVGSGISRRYINSPDWLGLLERLNNELPNKKYPIGYYTQNCNNHLPTVASLLIDEYYDYAWQSFSSGSNEFPKHLYHHSNSKSIFFKYKVASFMEQLMNGFSFEGHVYSEELDILKTLKPHVIITTNYDTLMEKIFPEYNVIIGQQVIKRRETTNIGHILKIHGCMTKPEEIVISKEDYDGFEERQKYLIAKLLTYFMEHPVVFLGYSLNDPNIKAILTDIAAILNGDSDEVVNNIWFIEWKEKIDSNFKPPTDKTIDLGNGKSIRVNYIQVNRFNEIFKSLYQHTAITMDILRELQSNIYNIIKSKTITNLEVDMVRLQTIKDEEELARLIGLTSICSAKSLTNEPLKVIGIGTIADPEQIIARYPMRISQLAEKLGLSSWYHVDVMIKKIYRETGFNIKGSNNRYHIDIGITQPEHRYSAEALMLFRKILNEEPYSVYDENDNELYPEFEQLAF
ncbi:SIR2 family protein [Thermolongibacillus altinsuensis]|uniref:SIR2 family protein n=1 Tax=Thermolongibacillus altinsuensis TaxID=575256 RepID=UPI00242A2D66|nr:SIR2 family protein [Thermolongibacillus altinsuensis]GMB10135.1 hypothetical protein B1no1_28450 [Thermolongibacillus altinsuensis]